MRFQMRSRNRGGFTLTELMITVALIGTIAAIAIPNFMTYQARSRRSEGFTNVAGIATSYKAYYAESGKFPDMVTETTALGSTAASLPDPGLYGGLRPVQMPWDSDSDQFFKIVGWKPDGNVYYSYDVHSASCAAPCTEQSCFTVTAHGDVNGDGVLGAVMYVHPMTDSAGAVLGSCDSAIGPGGVGYGPPVRPGTASTVYDEPAARLDAPY
jgi:type IV pilus assembly protein PilA